MSGYTYAKSSAFATATAGYNGGSAYATTSSYGGYPYNASQYAVAQAPSGYPTTSAMGMTYPTAQLARKPSSGAKLLNEAFAATRSSVPGNIDPVFFQKYDKVVGEYNSLSYVPNSITQTDKEIIESEKQKKSQQVALARNRKQQPKLSKRLQRNEHPRFFHYMQIGREDKVKRLKVDMQNLLGAEEKYVGTIKALENSIAHLRTKRQDLAAKSNRRQEVYATSKQMFDKVVKSVPATPRLQQILNSIAAQSTEIAKEEQLVQQVDQVISTLRQAEQYYQQSQRMLQQARRSNTGAAFTNFGDGGGFEMLETMQQANRDQMINQAQQPATQAGLIMQQAWTMFPNAARQRYPVLSSQIGQAPLPKLRSAHFGNTLAVKFIAGDIGDAFNDAHAAGKIRENMDIVRQCMYICNNQIQLVTALRQGIASAIVTMKQNLDKLRRQEQEERQQIFNKQRSLICAVPYATPTSSYATPSYATQSYATAVPFSTTETVDQPSAPPPALL